MCFAQPFIRVATTILIVWIFSCGIASPQTVSTRGGTSASFLLAHLPSAPERCARSSARSAVPRTDADLAGDAPSSCGGLPTATPGLRPCGANRPGTGCDGAKDLVQAKLEAMGKAGQKISRAREKVLEILGTENACSAWFREKDANPAATFQTLRFELDLHGEKFIRESRDVGALNLFRSPYVAKVMQGDGAYGTITINTKGAFFSAASQVLEVNKEGGPTSMRGTQLLYVGPYGGDTLSAQVVALLHEFGHVIDLLPTDEDNRDGKSVQNTHEVLRYCSVELNSLSKRSAFPAGH
jgi:hypothetical protein